MNLFMRQRRKKWVFGGKCAHARMYGEGADAVGCTTGRAKGHGTGLTLGRRDAYRIHRAAPSWVGLEPGHRRSAQATFPNDAAISPGVPGPNARKWHSQTDPFNPFPRAAHTNMGTRTPSLTTVSHARPQRASSS